MSLPEEKDKLSKLYSKYTELFTNSESILTQAESGLFVEQYASLFESLKDFSFDLMFTEIPQSELDTLDSLIDIMERDIDYGASFINKNFEAFALSKQLLEKYYKQ